jgi:hypothetical protein
LAVSSGQHFPPVTRPNQGPSKMKELKLFSSAMSIFVILGMLWLAAAKDFPPVHDVGF